MRADNRGEGGTLSLMALAQSALGTAYRGRVRAGRGGAALFYGDALITPAISVLSAVEGLRLVTPVFDLTSSRSPSASCSLLFAVQRHGTGRVAAFFGPITLVWFLAIAALGLYHLGDDSGVLAAFSPLHAIRFLTAHGVIGFVVLGSVFLAVTGAEALYADMGHFGRGRSRSPGRRGLPGAGAELSRPGRADARATRGLANPFFLMAPDWALLPLVLLATIATVIASQAVITGAFSITQQAIQLGLLPRMEIQYTSDVHAGQIFLPDVNRLLLLGVLLLVFMFETLGRAGFRLRHRGDRHDGGHDVLAFIVVWKAWHWPLLLAALFIAPFLLVDLTFLLANLLKVLDGGYVPLMIAVAIILAMWTWVRGTRRDLPQDPHRHAARST